MTPRPVKCWAVVGRKGHVFIWTAAVLRQDTIATIQREWATPWVRLRGQGYRVIRCTLVPEAEARDGE